MQNSTLEKKLRNYSLLSGTLLAAAGSANAQVVYHKLNPPVVLDTNLAIYNLDLNGDAATDFRFKEFVGTTFGAIGLGVYGTNSVVGSVKAFSSFKQAYPYVLSTGNKIGTSNKWFNVNDFKGTGSNTYYPILASSYGGSIVLHHGRWDNGETAKFVGLNFKKGGNTYYGWVRVTVPALSAKSVTILDYAYQSQAGTFILAGDTGTTTGIHAPHLKNASIYASGKNVFVKYTGAVTKGMDIWVRDVLGRTVYSARTNNEFYEFNLNNESAGTYMVTVKSGEAQDTKKLVIQ